MKLEEITDKIYAEGVEKGRNEAKNIVAEAEKKAKDLLERAEQEAAAKVARAEQECADLKKNTCAELKMYTEQSLNALRTEVTDLLTGKITEDSVHAATADATFMQGVILKMTESLAKAGHVTIDAKDAEALKTYFVAQAKGLMDKGVTINEVKGLKTAFEIKPEKGGYKLAFGEAELIAYFKEFLRPQLMEMLF